MQHIHRRLKISRHQRIHLLQRLPDCMHDRDAFLFRQRPQYMADNLRSSPRMADTKLQTPKVGPCVLDDIAHSLVAAMSSRVLQSDHAILKINIILRDQQRRKTEFCSSDKPPRSERR